MSSTKVTKLEALKALAEKTKLEVAKAVAEAEHAKFQKVDALPEVAEVQENIMYLLYNNKTEHYDIYVKIGEKLELLDDTSVDLSGYIEKEEGKGLIATEKVTKLDGIAEGATKVEAGTKEGTILVNGQEVVLYEIATEQEVNAVLDEVFGSQETV